MDVISCFAIKIIVSILSVIAILFMMLIVGIIIDAATEINIRFWIWLKNKE